MTIGPDPQSDSRSEIRIGPASRGLAKIFQRVTGYGFTKAYQAAGNQTIYEANEPYRLSLLPEPIPELTLQRIKRQPSRMLRPQYAIVPFTHRETELRLLRKWRDSDSDETSVFLLYGQGGEGKTRLAAEVAFDWTAKGWLALRAFAHGDRSGPDVSEIPWTEAVAGVLIIADYAERWATADLLTLLRDSAAPAGVPVRVLLLARSAGHWWQVLRSQLDRQLDVEATAMKLLPLGDTSEDRHNIFKIARNEFAAHLNVPEALDIAPPGRLDTDENYGLVLTVHMAALAAVLGRMRGDEPLSDPADISAFLLARERDFWQILYEQGRLIVPPRAIAQTVFTATLTGPLNHPSALAALKCAEVESHVHPGELISDHAICYPPRKDDTVLEPLYPDRLGEDFLALATPGHDESTYPSDPWAPYALMRLLATKNPDGDWPWPWLSSARSTLADIADRWPHIAQLNGTSSLNSGRHRRE